MRKAASSFAAGSEPLISKSEDTGRSSTKRKKSTEKSSRSGSTASLNKKSDKTKRKHSESSASIKAEGDYEFDQFKKLVYIFVARDSDMFVFEAHLEPKIQSAKYSAEIYEALNYF